MYHIISKILWVYLILAIMIISVAWVGKKLSKAKKFTLNNDGGIISSSGNLAQMNWFEMVWYDICKNIPYLFSSFTLETFRRLYESILHFIHFVMYLLCIPGMGIVLIYRGFKSPMLARKQVRNRMLEENRVRSKKRRRK